MRCWQLPAPTLKGLVLLTPCIIQPRGELMRTMMDEYGNVVRHLAQNQQAIFVGAQAWDFQIAAGFTYPSPSPVR